MANQGLNISPPPRKSKKTAVDSNKQTTTKPKVTKQKEVKAESRSVSFDNVAGDEKVQFNKRVTRNTADGFEMLAIKTRKKVPQLLEEALEMLESKYGKS